MSAKELSIESVSQDVFVKELIENYFYGLANVLGYMTMMTHVRIPELFVTIQVLKLQKHSLNTIF